MGIYVGAGGVKTVNSLYVGAGGVKTVTAVYVGAGGTYKVWPEGGYSLEDNGYLDTYGYVRIANTSFGSSYYYNDGTHCSVDRQTSATYESTGNYVYYDHWFSTSKPIDLSSWNYLCYGYYISCANSTSSSHGTNYLAALVHLATTPAIDCSSFYQSTTNITTTAVEDISSAGRYYLRSVATDDLGKAYYGYGFVICDISKCTQTNVYLHCGFCHNSGGYWYTHCALLDGYGPYLYTDYPNLSAPSGTSDGPVASFTMAMTSTVNNYTISA